MSIRCPLYPRKRTSVSLPPPPRGRSFGCLPVSTRANCGAWRQSSVTDLTTRCSRFHTPSLKRVRSTKATEPPHLGQTLLLRGITAVVADALAAIGRAPASAGPRRLAPLRARPALGVSVGEQQSHYCDAEQNKTDRAHGSSPSPSFRAVNAKGEAAA